MQEGTLASVRHTAVTPQVPTLSKWLAVAPDTVLGACPVRDVLDRIGDKWSVLVITLLGERPMRFTELKRSIGLVSQRMLTRTLRGLERDGLVTRTVHPVVPPRVDYELTELGHGLHGILAKVAEWAFTHNDHVAKAREEYDRQLVAEWAPTP
ncbi:winged helix-turn-helix transcriptional regulator [Mycobacterium sp.]|uniref:winged helix-turn-helix transcriptional regulator n=1 Tax=Mycobacterium sp. TaxID=1785 RepID=UPI002D8F22CD|nr:helix-turn-helix domain-containing protein [Mycobacterium sp.]